MANQTTDNDIAQRCGTNFSAALAYRQVKPAHLADSIGCTKQQVNYWKKRGVPATWAEAVERELRVDRHDISPQLAKSRHLIGEQPPHYFAGNRGGTVPIFSIAQAQQWRQLMEEQSQENNQNRIMCPAPHGPSTFAVRMEDDSMTAQHPSGRSFPEGCYIYVDPDITPTSKNAVLLKVAGSNTCICRLYINDAAGTLLAPINTTIYRTAELDTEKHTIIGVVVGSFTPETIQLDE